MSHAAHRTSSRAVRRFSSLRAGVEQAIASLGTGFLSHPDNRRLRAGLDGGRLDAKEYYRQLLCLVYRIMFLFAAEEHGVLLDPHAPPVARARYSNDHLARNLREWAAHGRGGPSDDPWRTLAVVLDKLEGGHAPLAPPALGSYLWGPRACSWLVDATCADEHLLDAIRNLSYIEDGDVRYPVDWRDIRAETLGRIYESLLELRPEVQRDARVFELVRADRHERKTTGSYYTPPSLVDCLLDAVLDPVLDEACAQPEPQDAILALTVCDPACGSGHILVAAARRIARRLADIRSSHVEPSPDDMRAALRDVISRCIYGVDSNPMAVALCKLSLWLEALVPAQPLSVLDGRIRCGDALLGATNFTAVRACQPVAGDGDEDPWSRANVWCAGSVWPEEQGADQAAMVQRLAREYQFFHWHLAFPQVFRGKRVMTTGDDTTGWTGGFDVVLGNPPYLNIDDAWGQGHVRLRLLKQLFPFVYSDKSDLQFYFLARAAQLARRRAGYVLSRAFLEGFKASRLRGWLARHSAVTHLIDFQNHSVFPEVGITIAIVAFAIGDDPADAVVHRAREDVAHDAVARSYCDPRYFRIFRVPRREFTDKPWNFAAPETRALLHKLDAGHPRLGSFMELGQGMQTGRNDAFTISREDIDSWGLSESLYRARIRNSEIKRFEVRAGDLFLLYLEDCTRFEELPGPVQRKLENRRESLESRAAFKRGDCAWWKYSWPLHAPKYGRARLVCPYMAKDNRFAYQSDRCSIGLTDTTVIFDSGQPESLLYILSLLNSRVLTFRYRFIGKLKGGGVREYFWNGLSQLPIPRIDFTDARQVAIHEDIVATTRSRLICEDRDEAMVHEARLEYLIGARLFGLERAEFVQVLDELAAVRNADVKEHGDYRTRRLVLDTVDAA